MPGIFLFLLAACSGTQFIYNRLGTILPWYVDDYVELTGVQERQLDEALQPFLSWHRQRELPQYVALLDKLDTSLDQPLRPAAVSALYSDLELAWLRLEQVSLEWLLDLGDELSTEQVQELLAYLQERQAEYEEEYLARSEEEYREDSYESFSDSLADYLGKLSREQRARLQQGNAALERSDAVWLQERATWLDRLAVIMERQPGWQQQIRDAVARRGETVSPRYQRVYQHNLDVIFNIVAEVLNSRTERQDRHLRAKLGRLKKDLQVLIAQGANTPTRTG